MLKDSRFGLLLALLFAGSMWFYVQEVLIPRQKADAAAHGRPRGNLSDLYPRWLGARELLLHHRDPYSAETTREIQQGFYGRQLDPAKPAEPSDQAAFAYPVYVVFLLAPTVRAEFPQVVAIARWLFLFGIAVSVPLWRGAVGFRVKAEWVVCAMVLALSSYPSMLEFYMQNLSAVVAVFLALASIAAVREWLALSGFLLALSTIKPQLSIFFVLWFLLWTTGQWRERKRLALSFLLTLMALVLGGEALLPGWLAEFLTAIRKYRHYTSSPSGLRMFFPPAIAWSLAALLVGTVIGFGWKRRRHSAVSNEFGWMLGWVAAVSVVMVPIALYNQLLLIPALLALLSQRQLIWKSGLVPRALTKATFACLGWQWIMAAALGLASLVLPLQRLQRAAHVPVYTALALPMITLLALAAIPGMARLRMGRSQQAAVRPGSTVV